ncbi:pyruvate dehydrogenase (acetyl-transferring) E1 component subunit alpha [Anaplasmataceae bacterium AB001_6]|nr:pyruvate dehydrogenase (acetyl-transferring) E1 component subunit alpha [Anaplasmataceae bacterium AB001_6]
MNKLKISDEKLLQMYHDMVLIRSSEAKIADAYLQGKIGGFCHLYDGQEAIGIAIEYLKGEFDYLITGYRCHGMMIACGADPYIIFAELLGKKDGISKGKGGSMHMFAPENNFYGGHGIVGSQISLGTGIAFANKYKGNGGVCFSCVGDGGMNQGQVYESFNMAAIWNLPVIYVIENNMYGMGTKINRVSPTEDLFNRGASFEIPGIKVDQMDLFNSLDALSEAKEHAMNKGPIIVEFKTYRYRGHSMSDPAKYRSKDEVKEMRKIDPMILLENYLLENKICDADKVKIIKSDINKQVAESMKKAEEAPEASVESLTEDVYCNPEMEI